MLRSRLLSTTTRLLNRGLVIDQVILDQLKHTSHEKSISEPNNSFLILNPNQFKQKTKRPRSPVKKQPRILPNLFQADSIDDGTSLYIKMINNLKISDTKVSDRKYSHLVQQLSDSFTAVQLREYLVNYYKDDTYKGPRHGVSKKKKQQLAHLILKDLWNIEKLGELTSMDDLLVSNEVKLQKKDMFLLLNRDGLLIKYLSRTGCHINFNRTNNSIRLKGTESQVNSANIILNSILNENYQETVDLSFIMKLILQKHPDFEIGQLSSLLQVHFEHLGDYKYTLTSLNKNQTKRAKRLLLWFLDYNTHVHNYLKLPEKYQHDSLGLLPFKDDESITWYDRLKQLFRISSPIASPSTAIDKRLELFNDSNLSNENNLHFDDINELKSFFSPVKVNEQSDRFEPASSNLLDAEVEDIYEKLTLLKSYSISAGEDKIMEPVFTVSFGNILVEKKTDSYELPEFSPDSLQYTFNSKIPLINDKIISLPPFSMPELSIADINHFKTTDPHDYMVQLKFQPSLYENELIEAPPVEMWINLNKYGKPEMTSLKLLTVENENNCYIALPDMKSDIKISCQVTGDLFVEQEDEGEVGSNSIQDILRETTSIYSKFQGQPGLEKFLEKSVLDFSGKVKPVFTEKLELELGGKKVEYQYICANFRRQIEFLYKDKLLQFSMIEGGPLGGRFSEILLVGEKIGKNEMNELINDSVALINQL